MNKAKDTFNNIKVLIVGSGIIGKSNAFKVSDYGFDITLVDQDEIHNSSNAALGILMGKIYQKRKGRSWILRQKSSELWPKWINILQRYNPKLIFEKPLFKITSDLGKFEKLTTFLRICIFVLTFGKTFNAPSVIINGLSSLPIVMCHI